MWSIVEGLFGYLVYWRRNFYKRLKLKFELILFFKKINA